MARPAAVLAALLACAAGTWPCPPAAGAALPSRSPAPRTVIGEPSPDLLAGQVAGARAAADAAARRVDALRLRYLELSRQAVEAGRRLAQSFAEQSRLASRLDGDGADLERAETVRAASIRAVYADGGGLGLVESILDAGSPDEALWRLSTAARIESGMLRRTGLDAEQAAAREAQSRQAAADAAEADMELTRALARFQDDVAAADETLARAQAELDRLTADARRLAAVQEAARRLAEARAAAEAARLASTPSPTALAVPPAYLATYRAAATSCPGLQWTLLAAVGQVESGHGRNNGPSTAGAIGPMQFMPATFAAYAVDGDHDGVTDPWNASDAIHTAAAYLCASGARGGTPEGIHDALFAYNHAEWYVDLVLSARAAITARYPD